MASEDVVVAKGLGLECCLCSELFTQPKLLACAHTFCKECLVKLYERHPQQNKLTCPTCRQITRINDGDISRLRTNILIYSLVEDLKSAKRSCTACDSEAKANAIQYGAKSDAYMWDPCTETHVKFEKTAKHDVVSGDDVNRGRVKLKRLCSSHIEEEKLYFCTSCNVSICFRCRVFDHPKPDHNIKNVSDYKKTIQKQVESLHTKVTTRIDTIEEHKELVKEQKAVVEVDLDQKIAEINQSYEEAVHHLTRQRNDLIDRCKQENATHIAQLEKITESDDTEICCIRSASELLGNGINALLERQTLAVHNTICRDFENILRESNPDATQPKFIADSAKLVKFIKGDTPISLGELRQWQLEKVSTFPLSHVDPRDAVPLPDGRVVIGYCNERAIETFTVDGQQAPVRKGVKAYRVSVLSDGRYVVQSIDNITLYTQAWERLDVKFNTMLGLGGMCVDRDDNIYVGSNVPYKIAVFRPEGGVPSREILCPGYKPWETCHMNRSKRLVVCDGLKSVRVIDDTDEKGTVLHHIRLDNVNTHIAVLKDDSILIACKEDDLLSITLYTQDLATIRSVLRDYPLVTHLWNLVALPTGEIVVVSDKEFIVFRKS